MHRFVLYPHFTRYNISSFHFVERIEQTYTHTLTISYKPNKCRVKEKSCLLVWDSLHNINTLNCVSRLKRIIPLCFTMDYRFISWLFIQQSVSAHVTHIFLLRQMLYYTKLLNIITISDTNQGCNGSNPDNRYGLGFASNELFAAAEATATITPINDETHAQVHMPFGNVRILHTK